MGTIFKGKGKLLGVKYILLTSSLICSTECKATENAVFYQNNSTINMLIKLNSWLFTCNNIHSACT